MHRFPFILVAGGALALAGCQNDFHKGPVYPLRAGFLPQNVYRANNVLALRRVVLLPPYDARPKAPGGRTSTSSSPPSWARPGASRSCPSAATN